MSTTDSIVLASNNAHKRDEIIRALPHAAGILVTPGELQAEFGPAPDPVEDGADYLANATIKAKEFARWSGRLALADDSGLAIDALDGRPGLYSARYAGENATFADNIARVFEELDGVTPEMRTARFICVLVICDGDERVVEVEGICPGRILSAPEGSDGFGYDPIFVPDGESRSFATMTADEKDAISHRGRALVALGEALRGHAHPLLERLAPA